MENPVIKIIQSLYKQKNVNNLRKHLNKKTITPIVLIVFLLIITAYFTKPLLTNYDLKKQIIEKKIKESFSLDAKVKGKISYHFLPSPRLEIKKVNLNFENSRKSVFLEQAYIILSPLRIESFLNFKFKKFLIYNENIQIYPQAFQNYFKYFTSRRKNTFEIEKSKIFFLDDQKNTVSFENSNLIEKLNNQRYKIEIESYFSDKKIKFKFINQIDGEKSLDINVPKLDTSINAIFDPLSNLNNVIGKSQIKLFDNILTISFKGKEKFEIYDSFFRNKFFNSKVDGEISFSDNFFFDINLGVNQINLRKFLLYYFPSDSDYRFLTSGISKKLNGKFKIFMKNTNSFVGRITDTKMLMTFENGDLKIENGSASLPQNSKIEFNILYTDNNKEPFMDFTLNFYSTDTNKFLRKFNIYDFDDKETSLFLEGRIDLMKNKVKLKNIVRNKNVKFDRRDILDIEKNFNEFVIDRSLLGITDFFRLKKFAKETLG
tara:strand:+ start:78 stop:1541 length:1464 start_codon:yes stop_codon:yes gene_type:complete